MFRRTVSPGSAPHFNRKDFLALFFIFNYILFAFPVQSQHRHKNGSLVFNSFDFQIAENYIKLNDTLNSKNSNPCSPTSYFDVTSKVQLEFISNCQGWNAIHITHREDAEINYYLNYQAPGPANTSKEHITIVTSRRGERSNEKAIAHFLSLIAEIKLSLLEPQYFSMLYHYLGAGGKEARKVNSCSFILHIIDHQTKSIEVSPGQAEFQNSFISYLVEQKITKRKGVTQWHYILPKDHNQSDDFFFKHYSDLLLEAKDHEISKLAKN